MLLLYSHLALGGGAWGQEAVTVVEHPRRIVIAVQRRKKPPDAAKPDEVRAQILV